VRKEAGVLCLLGCVAGSAAGAESIGDLALTKCSALVAQLVKADLSKREFETTVANRERGKTAVDGVQLPRVDGGAVAFAVPTSAVSVKYNADRGYFDVEVDLGPDAMLIGDRRALRIDLDRRRTRVRSYRASNAFGVKVEVTDSTFEVCGLAMLNRDSANPYDRRIAGEVDATPTAAQSLKPRLGVALVVQPAAPFISAVAEGKAATVASPYAATVVGSAAVVDLVAAWIYDKVTGQVLAKVPHAKPDLGGWPAIPASLSPKD